ncbi:MAG: hypothetical protein Q9174_001226 [Haloplaca sp. 1 TL-2023]
MSSPLSQVQYTSNQTAQSSFEDNYDFEDPAQAMAAYMKSIHAYTKSQMDSVKRSSGRRTDASSGVSQTANLSSESSVESTDSQA